MIVRCLLAVLALVATTAAAADDAARPGGIARVDVGPASSAAPDVRMGDRRVLVFRDGDRWQAVAGIPLDTTPGPLVLAVGDNRIPVTVGDHARTQSDTATKVRRRSRAVEHSLLVRRQDD